MKNGVDVKQWISWLVTVLTLTATVTAYAFTKFETKDHAKETKEDLTWYLKELKADMLETNRKLDQIIIMQRRGR